MHVCFLLYFNLLQILLCWTSLILCNWELLNGIVNGQLVFIGAVHFTVPVNIIHHYNTDLITALLSSIGDVYGFVAWRVKWTGCMTDGIVACLLFSYIWSYFLYWQLIKFCYHFHNLMLGSMHCACIVWIYTFITVKDILSVSQTIIVTSEVSKNYLYRYFLLRNWCLPNPSDYATAPTNNCFVRNSQIQTIRRILI